MVLLETMNPEEPSLLTHLNEVRRRALVDGGLTTVIFCGQVRSENDLYDALQVHRGIVEQEVNNEEVNITGILMGQVNNSLPWTDHHTYSLASVFLFPPLN